MQVVEPAPHEFAANAIFGEHGLQPFFACDRRIKAGDGSIGWIEFDVDGERWRARLSYSPSGFLPPADGETPAGTEIVLETIREFDLRLERDEDEDPVGQQAVHINVSPRWQGMRFEREDGSRGELSIPADLEEGVNCRISGSNVGFSRYLDLVRAGFAAVGVSARYFSELHPLSNVQDAESYVRIDADASGPIHARTGPIASLGHVLEDDRSGYRKIVQQDEDGAGDVVPGYYHSVTLGPGRVQAVFGDHSVPREIKHYRAREAASTEDEIMSAAKLGVSYQANRWQDSLGWGELDELERQLDQTLHSVLADAGVQLHPGEGSPFVADPYFGAESIEVGEDWLYPLDVSHIRHEQESIVVRFLADAGLSPVREDVLAHLLEDGGEVAPADIADRHGWHPDSVRRSIRQMEELLEREYGSVALGSPFIAELVYDAMQEARDSLGRAASVGAKAVDAAKRGLDETTSALVAWAASRGIDVDRRSDARVELRFSGELSNRDVARRIQEAWDLWRAADLEERRFRRGVAKHGEQFVEIGPLLAAR